MLIIPTRNRHIFNQMNLQFIRPLFSDTRLFYPRQTFNLTLDNVDVLRHKGARRPKRQNRLANVIVTRVVSLPGHHQLRQRQPLRVFHPAQHHPAADKHGAQHPEQEDDPCKTRSITPARRGVFFFVIAVARVQCSLRHISPPGPEYVRLTARSSFPPDAPPSAQGYGWSYPETCLLPADKIARHRQASRQCVPSHDIPAHSRL